MNTTQLHEAMQISRNFEKVNKAAKFASKALAELRSISGGYFITAAGNKILREADNIIDEIIEKSNEWQAAKFAEKTIGNTDKNS